MFECAHRGCPPIIKFAHRNKERGKQNTIWRGFWYNACSSRKPNYMWRHTRSHMPTTRRFSIKKGAYHLTAYTERTHRRLPHAITSSNSYMTAHTERAQRLRRTQCFSFFCFCSVLCGLILCSQNRSYSRFKIRHTVVSSLVGACAQSYC